MVAADIQLTAVLHILHELKDSEEHATTKADPPLINERDWTKKMEAIEEHLHTNLDKTKIPLSYIIREEVGMPIGPDPSAN
jgi:hypothetical protein